VINFLKSFLMVKTIEQKKDELKKQFSSLSSLEQKYQFILDLGKQQSFFSDEEKIEENRVFGCQSLTYLRHRYVEDCLYFEFHSDALISAGLGQLLSFVYSGEKPKTIVASPPQYLVELGIEKSLSFGRAQGLFGMYTMMRTIAQKFLGQ
jgi:cysteine desulfuration protein SufE